MTSNTEPATEPTEPAAIDWPTRGVAGHEIRTDHKTGRTSVAVFMLNGDRLAYTAPGTPRDWRDNAKFREFLDDVRGRGEAMEPG